ncbi:MAG: hypothetical protein IPK26_26325 [Planctomycetes bacterium]|nr:hypothetical protein [Planctomycetota bacterium]
MVDLTNAHKQLLQIKYTAGLQDSLYNKNVIRKRFKMDFETVIQDGSRVVDAVQVRRNNTARYVTEQEAFPEPQVAVVKNTAWFPTFLRGAGSVSYSTQKRTSMAASFAKALTLEMQGIKDDVNNKTEMTACTDGSGLLAQIVKVSSTTFRIPRANAYRLEAGYELQFWVVGDTTDFDNATTTTMRANPASHAHYTVSSVDFDDTNLVTNEFGHTNQKAALVTLEEAMDAAVATGDYITIAGALRAISGQVYTTVEMGIGGIVGMSRNYTSSPYDLKTYGATFQQQTDDPSPNATDSFYGIAPSTTPQWRPVAINADGADPDPRLFQRAMTTLKNMSGKAIDEVSDIYLHSDHLDTWASNRYAEERVMLSPENGEQSGNRGMRFQRHERKYPTYAGIPLCDSRYFDVDKAYVVMKNYIRFGVLEKFALWDQGDGGLHKNYARKPQIDFEFQGSENMAPKLRNCHAVIYNLNTTFA